MDWLTLLPPLIAVGLVMWSRDVIVSLLAAIFVSETLIAGGNLGLGFLETAERVAMVFTSPGNARLVSFCLLVGALIALMRRSGGVAAFVHKLVGSGVVAGPRRAGLLAAGLGTALFVETNLSLLTSGVATRGLFDRFGLSRARLAYLIDSTAAPISIVILFNGWGAYLLGLISDGYGLEDPVAVLARAAGLNIYAFAALGLAYYVAATGRAHASLARHEAATAAAADRTEGETPTKARFMIVPMTVLVAAIFGFLWWTGGGSILAGDGGKSVLWAMCLATVVAAALLLVHRRFGVREISEVSMAGMAELLPAVTVLVLALGFGASLNALGTGAFLAGVLGESLPAWTAAPAVFLLAGFISFTTGTSWGTFALLIPIALPVAAAVGAPPALVIAAVMGGGVFGDHCSPISDTTVLASLAAGVDHIDHVRTQLPYALAAAGVALAAYIGMGVVI
ncbi:MAG: Na+/H+ antiporter NhaC family protein [Maricaulaceae bacterium]